MLIQRNAVTRTTNCGALLVWQCTVNSLLFVFVPIIFVTIFQTDLSLPSPTYLCLHPISLKNHLSNGYFSVCVFRRQNNKLLYNKQHKTTKSSVFISYIFTINIFWRLMFIVSRSMFYPGTNKAMSWFFVIYWPFRIYSYCKVQEKGEKWLQDVTNNSKQVGIWAAVNVMLNK